MVMSKHVECRDALMLSVIDQLHELGSNCKSALHVIRADHCVLTDLVLRYA